MMPAFAYTGPFVDVITYDNFPQNAFSHIAVDKSCDDKACVYLSSLPSDSPVINIIRKFV